MAKKKATKKNTKKATKKAKAKKEEEEDEYTPPRANFCGTMDIMRRAAFERALGRNQRTDGYGNPY